MKFSSPSKFDIEGKKLTKEVLQTIERIKNERTPDWQDFVEIEKRRQQRLYDTYPHLRKPEKEDFKNIEDMFQQKSFAEKWVQSGRARKLTVVFIILSAVQGGLWMAF